MAVLLPDDVIMHEAGALAQMVDAHRSKGGHMVATMDVPREDVSSYGVLDVSQQKVRIAVLNRYTALGIPVTEPVG